MDILQRQAFSCRFLGIKGNGNPLRHADIINRIRPEIIELAKKNQEYWMAKYSPLIGNVQNWIYDLYLKGNKIESGRKNYSEVIGLLISYQVWKAKTSSDQ